MKVRREDRDGGSVLVFEGTLTENDNLGELVGPVQGKIWIRCRDITRLNSVGTKSWVLFFQELRNQSVQLTFQECSPAVIRLGNILSNFLVPDEIESICVPYLCDDCQTEILEPVLTAALNKPDPISAKLACPKCGAQAELDIEENEFTFLRS